MKKGNCISCTSFDPVAQAGPDNGQCRCNPPAVQLVMVPSARSPSNPNGSPMLTAQAFFPPVRGKEDWCEKYEMATPRLVS